MPELRWILIAVGVVLLAGLWWWESRRRRLQAEAEAEDVVEARSEAGGRSEPTFGDRDAGALRNEVRQDELPPIRASRRERGPAGRELPIVEVPADAEPELAPPPPKEEVPVHVPYRRMQESLDAMPEDLRNLPRSETAEADQQQPWVRTQPLDREQVMNGGQRPRESAAPPAHEAEAATAGGEPSDGRGDAAAQEREPRGRAPQPRAPERQKIVALRLVASKNRWPGDAVIHALETEGLRFGKYSIFHRERDDGKSIFYVASMIEPGSFDLEHAETTSFPGISIFAVLPGPVDAGTTFDLMLATGRRLAERLSGHLQDEQGSTLTAQRILNLREEIVHFEHVTRRVRSR